MFELSRSNKNITHWDLSYLIDWLIQIDTRAKEAVKGKMDQKSRRVSMDRAQKEQLQRENMKK